MGFSDVWNRTLVYFGIAEEDEDWDEDGYVTNEELERSYSERPNVRRLSPRRKGKGEFEDWTDPEPERGAQTAVLRPRPRAVPGRARRRRRPRPPRHPEELQRRPADRGQVQGRHAGHPQPPGLRPRPLQAPDRLRERPHVCARRRHAARGGQGLPAHAAKRRGLGRRARPPPRARRLLQPGLAPA